MYIMTLWKLSIEVCMFCKHVGRTAPLSNGPDGRRTCHDRSHHHRGEEAGHARRSGDEVGGRRIRLGLRDGHRNGRSRGGRRLEILACQLERKA